MSNLLLSQMDLNIEEVNLADVKGGNTPEIVPSGSGKDGRTGQTVNEYICIIDDETWFHIYK